MNMIKVIKVPNRQRYNVEIVRKAKTHSGYQTVIALANLDSASLLEYLNRAKLDEDGMFSAIEELIENRWSMVYFSKDGELIYAV